jgi:hypothetical protein
MRAGMTSNGFATVLNPQPVSEPDKTCGVMPHETGAELRNHRANLAPHYIWFERSAEIGFSAKRSNQI